MNLEDILTALKPSVLNRDDRQAMYPYMGMVPGPIGTGFQVAQNVEGQGLAKGLLSSAATMGTPALVRGLLGKAAGNVAGSAAREAWKKVKKGEIGDWSHTEGKDDFLYHVTDSRTAQKIAKEGLDPSRGGSLFRHGAYGQTSKNKGHLTERDGVNFWKEKIEQQLFDRYDNPPKAVVLKIPKSDIQKQNIELFADDVGTADANAGAWYIKQLLKGL